MESMALLCPLTAFPGLWHTLLHHESSQGDGKGQRGGRCAQRRATGRQGRASATGTTGPTGTTTGTAAATTAEGLGRTGTTAKRW